MMINNRISKEYLNGVEQFLNFASQKAQQDGRIICPCRKCAHSNFFTIDVVRVHLVSHGICRGYQPWIFHGESFCKRSSTASYQETNHSSHQKTNHPG